MVRTSWVYLLRKEELARYLKEFKLDVSGTMDEMRKRLATFVASERDEKIYQRLEELENKHGKCPTPTGTVSYTDTEFPTGSRAMEQHMTPGQVQQSTPQEITGATRVPYSTVIDVVRKWSFRYDGGRDPIAFIERVEELAEVYGLDKNMLPRTMPELLKDTALLWYRNNNRQWTVWKQFREQFLKFFLPPQYFENLEDDIRKRTQKPKEKFKDFVVALQNMMRHAGYTPEQMVERIFRNCQVDYRLYIRRKDFSSLDELIEMAEDYEVIRTSHPEFSHERREVRQLLQRGEAIRQVIPAQEPRINPATACRRCGLEGHRYRYCRNPSLLFCWQCGKQGVRTRECCSRNSENAKSPHHVAGVEAEVKITNPATLVGFKETDTRLLAQVQLGGEKWEATIDTGASGSYVSESVARGLEKNSERFPVRKQTSLANGTTVEVKEVIRTEVRLGGKGCQLELGVMSGMLDKVLLGLDFLRAVGCEVRCGDQEIRLGFGQHRAMATVEQKDKNEPQIEETGQENVKEEIIRQGMQKFQQVRGPTNIAEHKSILRNKRPVRQSISQRNSEISRRINQENPIDRVNSTVQPMLAQYAGPSQKTWDEVVPELPLTLNTAKSDTKQYTPAFLIQGRDPRLPAGLYDEVKTGTGRNRRSPEEKAEMLREMFNPVRKNMVRAAKEQPRFYKLRRRKWHPRVRESVRVRKHHLSNAADSLAEKLAQKFDGPYRIQHSVAGCSTGPKKEGTPRSPNRTHKWLKPSPRVNRRS